MKIQFLGTGAADWDIEKDFDDPEFRRNSSAVVDGIILIDPGACVPEAMKKFGIDPSGIKYVINTHRHSDHFNEENLNWLLSLGAEFIDLEGGERVSLGKYEISAYAGNHSIPAVHYIISDGEKKLFYGLDSAWLNYGEVQGIKAQRPDLAILDATIGFTKGDYRIFEHNDLNMVIEMKSTLSRYVKRFCISHMAKTLHTGHAELEAAMSEYGIEVARDGKILEL